MTRDSLNISLGPMSLPKLHELRELQLLFFYVIQAQLPCLLDGPMSGS
jgi:hypothetical protein